MSWMRAPLALALLSAACTLPPLAPEGRPCGSPASCGPGTTCDPLSGRCVARTELGVKPDLPPAPRDGAREAADLQRADGAHDARRERVADLTKPTPEGCKKVCAGACAPLDDPAFGCGQASCAACPAPTGTVAGCAPSGDCSLTCGAGATDCDGNLTNGCNLLASDGKHCGRCDHSCLGAACVAGKCQPIALASGQAWPMGIAVDAYAFYWANSDFPYGSSSDGKVFAALKSGQTVTVASGKNNVDAIAVDSSGLYFATAEDVGTVYRQQLSNPLQSISSNEGWATAIATNADAVYWPRAEWQKPGKLVRWDKTTKTKTTLDADFIVGLAVDAAGTAYWTDGIATTGRVLKKTAGGNGTTLADAQHRPWALVLDGGSLFWVNRGDGTVRSVGVGGGAVTTLATGGSELVGVAADAQYVYFTDLARGELLYLPRAGGAVSVLASGQSSPHNVVVDSEAVYWTNYTASGAVMKIGKP